MRKPISFLGTSDSDNSKVFYSDVLGLELIEDTEFALVFRDAGHMLRIQKLEKLEPAPYTSHGWQVDDIERSIAELTSKGVEFSRFDRLEHSPSGVWVSPSGDRVAWFKDPCGNNLSLTQFD